MKVFKVERTDKIGFLERFRMIIVAKDKETAEKIARKDSDMNKSKNLKIVEIDLTNEQVIETKETNG